MALALTPAMCKTNTTTSLVIKRDTGTDHSWWDIIGDLSGFTVEVLYLRRSLAGAVCVAARVLGLHHPKVHSVFQLRAFAFAHRSDGGRPPSLCRAVVT